MTTISVSKAFRLTLDDHSTIEFSPGVHEVSDEIAAHWYVIANSNVVEAEPEAAEAATTDEIEPRVSGRGRKQQT